ncbi:MAG: hypothetical protein AAF465_04310 [Pseudomonadota bacterium]
MKRLLLIITLSIICSCASHKSVVVENELLVARVIWVKLFNKEFDPERQFENNAGELVSVSNACGKAEVRFRSAGRPDFTVWMEMGEWCTTPFSSRHSEQLILIGDDSKLIEYHGIEKDSDGRSYIDVENWSRFADLRSPLAQPKLIEQFDTSEEAQLYFEGFEEELIKIDGRKVFLLKGVFLSNAFKAFTH